MKGADVFRWGPVTETHEERVKLLASLMRCAECAATFRDGYLGELPARTCSFADSVSDEAMLLCGECAKRAEELGATHRVIGEVLTPEEVLDVCGVLISPATGQTFLPTSLVMRHCGTVNARSVGTSATGESHPFEHVVLIIQGAAIQRKVGRVPFQDSARDVSPSYTLPPMTELPKRATWTTRDHSQIYGPYRDRDE